MIDVHPPHERIHGWRDFFLHLTTITIGLLIALSLEGLVEAHHHRRLASEARADLHAEIKIDASTLHKTLDEVHKQQEELKEDVVSLNYISKHRGLPHSGSLTLSFSYHTFDSTSWETAQSTGALAYMPYAEAHEYGDLYYGLSQLRASQQQALQYLNLCLGPLLNMDQHAADPTGGQSEKMKQNIQVLQSQLLIVEDMMSGLDKSYEHFLSAHPN